MILSKRMMAVLLLVLTMLAGCGERVGEGPKEETSVQEGEAVSPGSVDDQETAEPDAQETEGGTTDMIEPEQLAASLLAGEYERIYNQMSEDMQEVVSREDFESTAKSFTAGVQAFHPESVVKLNGAERFVWLDDTRTKGVLAAFGPDGLIEGLQVLPLETFPETDGQLTEQRYALPFKGHWFVFWGGTNVMTNYHYAYESQRYAFDFVKARNGMSYEGDPQLNESYFAFGQDVLAAADGEVVGVVNDVKDNKPLVETNENEPAGNYVVIDHGGGEYSITAHFRQGSIAVREGDRVRKGDLLGQAGNSGNSSEPHIHFQISDSPDLMTGKSLNVKWDGGFNIVQGETVEGAQD